jgi:transcriptional regulator with XRE-family HTH domain
MTLSDKLKWLCGERRWGQADLMRAMGGDVSKSAMSDWFKGKFRPDLDSTLRMARALKVPLDYLADDALDEPPVSDLSDDERYLLRVWRDSGLSVNLAAGRIMGRFEIEAGVEDLVGTDEPPAEEGRRARKKG